jgi:hypothetical protein
VRGLGRCQSARADRYPRPRWHRPRRRIRLRIDVQRRIDDLRGEDFPGVASVGIGLYVTAGSGVAAAVGALGYLVNRH